MQGSGAITVCCDQKSRSAVKLWLRFWMLQFAFLFGDIIPVGLLLVNYFERLWLVKLWSTVECLEMASVSASAPCFPCSALAESHVVGICTLSSGIFTVLLVTEATIWSDSDSHFMKIQLPELRVYPVEWATSSCGFPIPLHSQKLTGCVVTFLGCQTAIG